MKKPEFIIVGQGLAGTLLAFEMLEVGIDFRIVSSPQKSRSSLVAAGMVNPLVFKRLTKSWLADKLLPIMKKTYQGLENRLQQNFLFDKRILKPLSEQEKALWMERKQQAAFSPYIETIFDESPVEHLKAANAYGLVSQAAYLDLRLFLSAAERFFREKNLLLDEHLELEVIDGQVNSFFKNFSCTNVVFCEGYHLINNSLFEMVKLKPVKGEVLEIYAPELSEDYILNKKVFVLPIGYKRFKVGSTYDWNDLSEDTSIAGKASILERLNNLVSTEYMLLNHQAGVRPTVIDRRPVLGKHPKLNGVFVFNGLGTKGVMLAPYFAKEMIRVLSERNYSLVEDVDIQRFY